jgi:hypothetical protein
MSTQLNSGEGVNSGAGRGWLAGVLLRHGDNLAPRLAYYYRKVAALPRPWRRQLRRKLALTVSGAALLLALAGPVLPPALADANAPEATINVVNGEVAIVNNNKCSLWEAIINARATAAGQMRPDCTTGNVNGPDTVSLPAGGDFVMTTPHNSQFGPTGLPVITSSMTIEGHGATIRRSTASGTPHFRIMAVDPGVTLTIRDTTIRDGYADNYDSGGAILSQGDLTIENSTIANNAAYSGGGIKATQATITGSRILENRSCTGIGHDYCLSDGGGGISAGELTLVDSTVADNVAIGGLELAGRGGGLGGGILTFGETTIIGSTISGNQATSGFGDIGDRGLPPGLGGGLLIQDNATIVNSTISGNEANDGGGIMVNGGDVALVNSTLTGNHALYERYDYYDGYMSTGGSGGGLAVFQTDDAYGTTCPTVTAVRSLISSNTADTSGRELLVASEAVCAPAFVGNAFNVFGRGGSAGTVGFNPGPNDIVPSAGLNAILSPLANNGGPTLTHALPAGSPALDVAPNATCTAAPVNGVDQRGQPRNQNGKGGASANECDAGSFELQTGGGGGAFLVSAAGTGNIGGVAFTGSDILKFDPAAGWSLYFDGSDVGVTKGLTAFELLGNGDILMSFASKVTIPGVGSFLAQDVARFDPTSTGPNTAGAFHWALDGSTRFLTTNGEKIDALADAGNGQTAISTMGAATVKLPNGAALKAQDEDALAINLATGDWSAFFNGTAIPGLGVEDVNAMWIDPATGDVYITIVGAFNLGGVSGNGRDIVKLTKSGATYTPSLWWDGSAVGFPVNVNGLEILP